MHQEDRRERGSRRWCVRCSRRVADPGRAPAMAAYMKGIAPYLGVPTPARRAATRDWIRGFDPGPRRADLLAAARELVTEPEREFAYVAIDLVARHERALPESSLLALRDLALERPWWDTVDAWSTLIGRAGLRHRSWDRQVARLGHRRAALGAPDRPGVPGRPSRRGRPRPPVRRVRGEPRRPRLLHAQGDRLGPARRGPDPPRRGPRVRRGAPRPGCPALSIREATKHL